MYGKLPEFESAADELRFLRGLVSVQRMADEVLEDCLSRELGLAAALDVFLTQCARMIHASGAFVRLQGASGPVLTRSWGAQPPDPERYFGQQGAIAVDGQHTVFVTGLTLGEMRFGALGFVLPGHFEGGAGLVMSLVESVGEMLDSAVLGFLGQAHGGGPLAQLDELGVGAAFRPKTRLGRYELVAPLGTGGMAQVMIARTLGPSGVSRLVALKRILPHLSEDPLMVEQFLDEARIGLRLSHPNLVTFHDFGQAAGGGYYIAMELLRGVDLDRLIYGNSAQRTSGVEPAVAVGAVVQALAGLHAAHEVRAEDGIPLGLVHRDLSPHNLMVGFDGRVKLLDFGVAKLRNQRTVTLPGIVKGKPLYMSPEQAVGDRVDRRSDLFSMGLILFEALTGTRCFGRADDTSTMEAIVGEPLPARPGRIPQRVWEVIRRALNKRPEDRYRTALDMSEELLEASLCLPEQELGRLVLSRFEAQHREYARWDQSGTATAVEKG